MMTVTKQNLSLTELRSLAARENVTTMDETNKKLAYNIGGGVIGVILALVAIFGLVAQQGSVTQPQKYSSNINYDSSN